jgi:hypothetical protein
MASRGSKIYPHLVSLFALSFGVQGLQFELNYNDPYAATNLLCRRAPVNIFYRGGANLYDIVKKHLLYLLSNGWPEGIRNWSSVTYDRLVGFHLKSIGEKVALTRTCCHVPFVSD